MTHAHRDPLAHLVPALEELERQGLRRFPRPAALSGQRPSFCSNDYLGLADRPAPHAAAGAGASRLVTGDHPEHAQLERSISSWLGTESALVFSSGYAANLGTIGALARTGDLIVSDALNHASLIDGARLSRARVAIVPHNDVAAVADVLTRRTEPRAWVVVESYYSMDADGPDLRRLRSTCDAHGAALFVDEAHALGVLGPDGRGRCAEAGVVPDVFVGTLGKALGGQGAFVAGRVVLRDWLWNRARSFVFSTGLSPAAAAAARGAIEIVQASQSPRARIARLARRLRDGVADLGLTPSGFAHIVPIILGGATRTVAVATRLRDLGLDVVPIRPPTVPDGTARLRLTVTAKHCDDDVDFALGCLQRVLTEVREAPGAPAARVEGWRR